MEKHKNRIIILLFSLFIGGFFLLNLILPDNSFSPKENRYLQTMPTFSARALFRGRFTADFEKYCADQFAFRDWWISRKARMELMQGKSENNGVFLCQGERLIEPFSAPAEGELDRRISAVKAFYDRVDVPVVLSLIPTASELYGELLPAGAPNDAQSEVIRYCCSEYAGPFADLMAPLEGHKGEELFYRTDHHWTSLGAFRAYQGLADALGYEAYDLDHYERQTVSEDFSGTAYSASGFFWVEPDRMEVFRPAPDGLLVERYESSEPLRSALYHEEMLETKDKYRFFLGGNAPRVVLHTGNDGLPSLLIVRDSYSDSLCPFLLDHFSSIHLLDLRYYRESVSEYVRSENIDQVLVLYSVNNFCTDSNLMMMAQ